MKRVFRVGTSRHTEGQPDSLGRGSFLDGCSPQGPGTVPLEEGRWEVSAWWELPGDLVFVKALVSELCKDICSP